MRSPFDSRVLMVFPKTAFSKTLLKGSAAARERNEAFKVLPFLVFNFCWRWLFCRAPKNEDSALHLAGSPSETCWRQTKMQWRIFNCCWNVASGSDMNPASCLGNCVVKSLRRGWILVDDFCPFRAVSLLMFCIASNGGVYSLFNWRSARFIH